MPTRFNPNRPIRGPEQGRPVQGPQPFARGLNPNPASYVNWQRRKQAGKMDAPLGPAAWYAPAHQQLALGYGGQRVGRLASQAAAGEPGRLEDYLTAQGRRLGKQAIQQAQQGGYLTDASRDYLRQMGFHVAGGGTGGMSPTAGRGARLGPGSIGGAGPAAGGVGAGGTATGVGLPLDPLFEAQRRALEDALAAQLQPLGPARDRILAEQNLQQTRLGTNQGVDQRRLMDLMAARGIVNSGIQARDTGRLATDYLRQYQDLANTTAGQLGEVSTAEAGAQAEYQRGLMELLLALANRSSQDPYAAVANQNLNQTPGYSRRRR